MNVRIFWVRAMECMCAQSRPRFILSPERVLGQWIQKPCEFQGKIPSTGEKKKTTKTKTKTKKKTKQKPPPPPPPPPPPKQKQKPPPPRRVSNPRRCIEQDRESNTLPTRYSSPGQWIILRSICLVLSLQCCCLLVAYQQLPQTDTSRGIIAEDCEWRSIQSPWCYIRRIVWK